MNLDSRALAAVNRLSREALIDILDECFGVGCRDEQDDDKLRAEVLAAHKNGRVSSEELGMA